MLSGGLAKRALVVGGDVLSKLVDWHDRSTCVLFGDGAGAVVLERVDRGGFPRLRARRRRRRWDGPVHAGRAARACRRPRRPSRAATHYVQMNGREVFKFATRVLVCSAEQLLDQAGIDDRRRRRLRSPPGEHPDHRSRRRRSSGIPPEKVIVNVDRYGNTSSGSIPLALAEAAAAGMISEGDIAPDDRYGSGLTWGSGVMDGRRRWRVTRGKIAFCFPGQGSLERGMGRDIAEAVPEAMARLRARAARRLGSTSRLCFDSALDELVETEVQQPALVATSLAVLARCRREARARLRDRPLGRGVRRAGRRRRRSASPRRSRSSASAALRWPRRRRERPGSMAAILGLDDDVVERLCRRDPRRVACELQLSRASSSSPARATRSTSCCAQAEEAGARRTVKLQRLRRVPLAARRPRSGTAAARGRRGRFGEPRRRSCRPSPPGSSRRSASRRCSSTS